MSVSDPGSRSTRVLTHESEVQNNMLKCADWDDVAGIISGVLIPYQ